MEINNIKKEFKPPFRVGKKRNRAILDNEDKQYLLFPIGFENEAIEYCEFLNFKKNFHFKDIIKIFYFEGCTFIEKDYQNNIFDRNIKEKITFMQNYEIKLKEYEENT